MTTAKAGRTANGPECRVGGCRYVTSENKPYCIHHLDRLPYVKSLNVSESDRHRRAPTSHDDPRCYEALEEISISGAMSPRRLADRLGLSDRVLDACVALLVESGLLAVHVIGKNRRGTVRRLVAPAGDPCYKIDVEELDELDDPEDLFDLRDRRRRVAQAS